MSAGYRSPLWPLGIAAPPATPSAPADCLFIARHEAWQLAPLYAPTLLIGQSAPWILWPAPDPLLAPRPEPTIVDAEGC